jgi:DNA-binding transcriptional MerR regulator
MKIAELSRRSGVPVPTIKYYLRENLLRPGELTSPNQASYGEHHLQRLRLVRALIDLGNVPVAKVREVLESLDSPNLDLHDRIGHVNRAITPSRPLSAGDVARSAAREQVSDLVEQRGWIVEPDAPALNALVEAIAAIRSLGQDQLVANLGAYADAVQVFTDLEIAAVTGSSDPDRIAESVIIGTILCESVIAALRLIAQEDASARRLRATV